MLNGIPGRLCFHVVRPLRLREKRPDDLQTPDHAVRRRVGRDSRDGSGHLAIARAREGALDYRI